MLEEQISTEGPIHINGSVQFVPRLHLKKKQPKITIEQSL